MADIGVVQDLSGVGRCSLTAAISVLSAMGHHCCPLPTAVLSNQTGFARYTYLDFTPYMPEYLRRWEELNLSLDLMFFGFLGGKQQPRLLGEYLDRHPEVPAVVDPVLGDHGELYPCFDRDFVQEMRALVARARIVTPNLTELLLLAGEDPASTEIPTDARVLELVRALDAPQLTHAVITGAVEGDWVCTFTADLAENRVYRAVTPHTGVSYSGTGDIFASIVCGRVAGVAGGVSVQEAAREAAQFVSRAAGSMDPDGDPRYGLHYEEFLHTLRICVQ